MRLIRNLSISRSIIAFITFIVFFVLMVWGLITYNIFFGTTNEIVETTTREINKQIIMNYENYIFDVIEVANFITEASVEYTGNDDIDSLTDIYQTMDRSNEHIASITLLDLNGVGVVSSEQNKYQAIGLESESWFVSSLNDKSVFHFSSPHNEDVYLEGSHQVISVSKAINYISSGIENVGILIIELEVSNFDRLTEVTNLGEDGHIVITNENYETVFTNNDACYFSECESIDLMKETILGGRLVEVDGTRMYMNVNTISLTRWTIATYVNAEQIDTARDSVVVSMIVASVVSVFFTIIISSMFSKRITSPIYKLNEYMKKFQRGSLSSKVEVEGQKELVELSESFNEMIDEISTLMNQVMSEQRAKRKTQMIALQNQINPHFLYNTLDSILWLNENKLNEDVEKMIVALSRFFRTSISTEKNIIPLSEEIEHAKNYLLIQKIRYHNKFSYVFEVDDHLLDFNVLKLGLQPVVENAIYHGIHPEDGKGIITIRAYESETSVILEVENTGYGISQVDIDKIYDNFKDKETSKHIGLKNISQRLQLYYGEMSKVEIVSEPDEHTIVRLIFPKKRGECL